MAVHDSENNLQNLMIELGHKMPLYCRSLLHPDHEIIQHLQFNSFIGHMDNVELNLLPVERVLSPFLVLVVCEKIYEDFSLLDDSNAEQDCANSSDNIYALYNQVLSDFDCLISLLTGLNDDIAISSESCEKKDKDSDSSEPGGYDRIVLGKTSCTAKLHRRTILIIEDICTLIGMRLGTLDVLNSLERKDAPSGTAADAIRTLDRIIACTKSIRSKHTAPLIQRAATVARAVRTYMFARRALLECRYADTTILMFDFKQLLKSLETNRSAGTSAGKRANDYSKTCLNERSSNTKRVETGISSGNCKGIRENDKMEIRNNNDKVEKRNNVEQDMSKQHLTQSATSTFLESLMKNLKNLHNIVFKDFLNQTSILVNNVTISQTDGVKGPVAESSSTTETSYVGGILDQASSFLPGMPTQSLGFLDNPSVYITRLSSTSMTSTSSSSSGSSSADRDRTGDRSSEVNKHDGISKPNTAVEGVSNRLGPHSDALPKGFVCPTRSAWSQFGSLVHT